MPSPFPADLALPSRCSSRARQPSSYPLSSCHRCPCVHACTLKARRWAHSALAGAERACMHLVRPLADTPCSRSLPICGRIGVSRSILCSGLLPSGGASQTNMVFASPCTDQNCSQCEAAPVRPCVQSPMPFGFASPLGHVSQGTSRVVGLGDVSRHFCRTVPKPFPSCVGSLWHGFHDAVRVSPSGPHRFSVALLVALPLA